MNEETLCKNCGERAYDESDEKSGRCFCVKHLSIVSLRGWCNDFVPPTVHSYVKKGNG